MHWQTPKKKFLSVMNHLENVQLSSSKRPILMEDEIELILQAGVALYEGFFFDFFEKKKSLLKTCSLRCNKTKKRDSKSKYEKTIVYLTNMRIICVDSHEKLHPVALHLSKLTEVVEVVITQSLCWDIYSK